MRLTLKKVEQAKKDCKKAEAAAKVIKAWQEAVKKIGPIGNQKIVAITIKDGKISTECELDETAGKPILQQAEK